MRSIAGRCRVGHGVADGALDAPGAVRIHEPSSAAITLQMSDVIRLRASRCLVSGAQGKLWDLGSSTRASQSNISAHTSAYVCVQRINVTHSHTVPTVKLAGFNAV
jgi:hypothetical protein